MSTAPSLSAGAIHCRGLTKRYGELVAVNGVDLDVRPGECFGLLGPNGAGKTTTIEILEGLLAADGGEVSILGERWGRGRDLALRERLGIQLQETKLTDKASVEETLVLFRSFYSKGPSVDDVIRRVALEEKRRSWVVNLSGGQRQRLSLACALVNAPEILFLDEPTTGLDPQSRRQVWDLVEGFRGQGGTIVLTTHYMDEAEKLCDQVAIMDHGKVIALGTPRELIATLGADHVVEVAVDGELDVAVVAALPGVSQARREAGGYSLIVKEPHVSIPALLDALQSRRLHLARLAMHNATLEDVFMSLTGRTLRDE